VLKNILVKDERLEELILNVFILLWRKLISTKLPIEQLMLTSSMELLLRFKVLRFLSMLKQVWKSIAPLILLSCKSIISKLVKFSRFVILVMLFIDRIKFLMFIVWFKLVISESLFELRSRKCKFGRETRFSILVILLFCKLRYLIFSSPSRSGIWVSPLESRHIFSGLVFLSHGLL
jgi:hypothetical protein